MKAARINEVFVAKIWFEKYGTGYRILSDSPIHRTVHVLKQVASLGEAHMFIEKALRRIGQAL